jgi:phage FluMu protein Com
MKRCAHCGTLLATAAKPVDAGALRAPRCSDCEVLDPIKLPANIGWTKGELRPPR